MNIKRLKPGMVVLIKRQEYNNKEPKNYLAIVGEYENGMCLVSESLEHYFNLKRFSDDLIYYSCVAENKIMKVYGLSSNMTNSSVTTTLGRDLLWERIETDWSKVERLTRIRAAEFADGEYLEGYYIHYTPNNSHPHVVLFDNEFKTTFCKKCELI